MSRKKQITVLMHTAFSRKELMRVIALEKAFLIVTQLGVRILIRPNTMWRAFFCAIGIVLIIMGIECLLIDSAVLVAGVLDDPNIQIQQQTGGLFSAPVQTTIDRVFRPSEWFPWSLLASGAITLLYSISLRKPGP